MKIKTLLLMGGMLLTLTACSQSTPSAEEAADTSEDVAVAEEVADTDAAAENDSVETDKGNDASGEESEQVEDSLFNPPEIFFKGNGDDVPLYYDLKATFEENEYTNYLYDSFLFGDSDDAEHAIVFGFNVPKDYESDFFDGEMHPLPSYSYEEKQALRVATFRETLYPEYPSVYSFLNPNDYSSLYLLAFQDKVEDIRNYLQNGTPISTLNTDMRYTYPMFLSEDTVIQLNTMETIDTVYGSCDILFMELESPDAEVSNYYEVNNPIYIEAAYFSLHTSYEEPISTPEDPHFLLCEPDIAVIYMYPFGDTDTPATTTYEGHLAELLPEMLTPVTP